MYIFVLTRGEKKQVNIIPRSETIPLKLIINTVVFFTAWHSCLN